MFGEDQTMSKADQIAPHLPYLRRYARALTGSQESGDNYVLSVLEALVEDPSGDVLGTDAKVGLYRAFNRIWQSLAVNVEDGDTADVAAERNVAALTPRARQAFLLTALEGFTPGETAEILQIEEGEVGGLVDKAGREIAEQVATTVLVIEDEPLIAMDIEQMIESMGHTVSGIARTRDEASALLEKDAPGLVLADIQLADGSSGIDAVNDILKSINVPVIFITAFPERLLTGKRPEPAFLVTKPFHPDMVKALVSQALFFQQKAGTGN